MFRIGKFVTKNASIKLDSLIDFNLIKLKKYSSKDGTPFILEAVYEGRIKRCFLGALDKKDKNTFYLYYELGDGELLEQD